MSLTELLAPMKNPTVFVFRYELSRLFTICFPNLKLSLFIRNFLFQRDNVRLWVVIEDLARQLWKMSVVYVTVNKVTAPWPADTTAELPVLVRMQNVIGCK